MIQLPSVVLTVFILMKFLSASPVYNFRDGDGHLADEARGEGVTAEAILLMHPLMLLVKRLPQPE